MESQNRIPQRTAAAKPVEQTRPIWTPSHRVTPIPPPRLPTHPAIASNNQLPRNAAPRPLQQTSVPLPQTVMPRRPQTAIPSPAKNTVQPRKPAIPSYRTPVPLPGSMSQPPLSQTQPHRPAHASSHSSLSSAGKPDGSHPGTRPPAQSASPLVPSMAHPRIQVLVHSSSQRLALSTTASFSGDELSVQDDAQPLVTSDLGLTSHRPPPAARRRRDQAPGSTGFGGMDGSADSLAVRKALERPAAPQESERKKRGRPKGWKPGMPSKRNPLGDPELLAAYQQRLRRKERGKLKQGPGQAQGQPRPRGRPGRKAPPTPRGIFEKLRPHYTPFICEWAGCQAELQNMATLRKHVRIVHVQEMEVPGAGQPECRWAKCGTRLPPPEFASEAELAEHVEQRHLEPFVWHMGDGYSNRGDCSSAMHHDGPDSLPAYLFDKNGNQVTPSVRGQAIENHATRKANQQRLRAVLLEAERNAPYEDEIDMADLE